MGSNLVSQPVPTKCLTSKNQTFPPTPVLPTPAGVCKSSPRVAGGGQLLRPAMHHTAQEIRYNRYTSSSCRNCLSSLAWRKSTSSPHARNASRVPMTQLVPLLLQQNLNKLGPHNLFLLGILRVSDSMWHQALKP